MRVVILQYAGDLREAVERLDRGEAETYFAQRYCIDSMANLVQAGHEVANVVLFTDQAYDEKLGNGLRAIGMGWNRLPHDLDQVFQTLEGLQPEKLILRTLWKAFLEWSVRQTTLRVILTVAESRQFRGLRGWWGKRSLTKLLNQPRFEWVSNHQLPSSRWLESIGVQPSKLIPWDCPHVRSPAERPAKTTIRPTAPYLVQFVGAVVETKGVGVLLRALAILAEKGLNVHARIAGRGTIELFQEQAKQFGIADRVQFQGAIAQVEVIPNMADADIVVVPSLPEYSEAFPFVILEGLCSRSPIVASDHPMFQDALQHEKTALVYPAKNPQGMATCIQRLIQDEQLYQQLSAKAEESWNRLQIPTRLGDVWLRWVQDQPEDRDWLLQQALSNRRVHQT